MQKKRKVLTCLMLLFLFCITVFDSALADESEGFTITISNSAGGYTYEAYQIFAGRVSTDPDTSVKILSDITWGSGITEAGIAALEKAYASSGAAELAGKLAEPETSAEEFAFLAGEYLCESAGLADTCTDGGYVITVPDSGYYLVKNTVVPAGGTYTSCILQVVGNVTVKPKSDWPSCDKKVEEENDADAEGPVAQTTADHDIGDAVNFVLTATLPETYADFETYRLYFHDQLCKGMTFDAESVRAFVFTPGSGTFAVQKSGFKIVTSEDGLSDSCTFEVQFANLNALRREGDGRSIHVHKDSVITVTYAAALNDQAVIGNPGNLNTLFIGYSDNPCESISMNRTPVHEAVVFTYELVLKKVDGKGEALKGAAFELYKYHALKDRWEKSKGLLQISRDGTKFTFTGLDAGRYKLVESRAPEGYNRMEDLFFTVEAEHRADTSSTTGFCARVHAFVTDRDGKPLIKAGEVFSGGEKGVLETKIVNQKGSFLPGTGGAGAVIFYTAGVLFLAAAALLFLRMRQKKRHEKPEEKD